MIDERDGGREDGDNGNDNVAEIVEEAEGEEAVVSGEAVESLRGDSDGEDLPPIPVGADDQETADPLTQSQSFQSAAGAAGDEADASDPFLNSSAMTASPGPDSAS